MKKCPDCGNECNDDAKFCDDCGYAFPQTKECPQCHAELKLTARFCSECGYRFQAQTAEAKGSFMGDKNVISGDVAGGNLDRRQFYGNVTSNSNTSNVITNTTATTNVYNQDEGRKLETCSLCGHRVLATASFVCPECHRTACLECRDERTGLCRDCARSEAEKREADYRKALEEVYVNGLLARPEDRYKLDGLQRRLGLSAERAAELENEIKKAQAKKYRNDELTTIERINLNRAYGCLYHDGDAAKAEELLLPLYSRHKSLQNVAIYAPLFEAISYRDETAAKEKIDSVLRQADIPELNYLLFDIAMRKGDLVLAESTLRKLEILERGSVMFACRRIVLQLALSKEMRDRGMMAEVEGMMTEVGEMVSKLPDAPVSTVGQEAFAGIRTKMEASWVCRVKNLFREASGEEVPLITKELCEQRNLFYAVTKGQRDKREVFSGMFDLSGVSLKMINVKAGRFQMGSPVGELGRFNNEKLHWVTLTKDYWLGETQVTQGQWKAVMENNPSCFKKGDNYPVECVSWDDAMDFCKKLNERYSGKLPIGYRFSLPTEAQWEYACRAGTTTALNSGKNLTNEEQNCQNLNEVGWYDYMGKGDTTHPVAQKKPNAWGFYDMHGNVLEWCRDWYQEDYGCNSGDATDPQGPPSGSFRVYRGGSWYRSACYCRSAVRSYYSPSNCYSDLGFRLALVPVQ